MVLKTADNVCGGAICTNFVTEKVNVAGSIICFKWLEIEFISKRKNGVDM